ncbi:MFS transporter [Paenarthrobacter nicotinovorans]|uniref:MFS transporter n=1 Tax=Paenarthrobacter nicotinovorans TaxID=29320 RepID=UPI003D6653CE
MVRTQDIWTLGRRRWVLFGLFAGPGFAISSWVARTPEIRDSLAATTTEMGLVLFGVSAGAILGLGASAPLIRWAGTRRIAMTGMTGVVASMPAVGMGAHLGSAFLVTLGLFLFGLGMGLAEVAANVEAASLEREAAFSVLRPMHGWFSIGAAIGALAGMGSIIASVPVFMHLALVGILVSPILLLGRGLSSHAQQGTPSPRRRRSQARALKWWSDKKLLLVGIIVFSTALAEGAATDWLPLVMVDGHGNSAAMGSVIFAAFACFMAIGRFSGGYLLNRYRTSSVFRLSAALAILGIGCVVFVGNQVVAGFAVVLWGLGLALGVPVAIAAVADSSADAPARVAFVTVMGYLALLGGPPALGALGGEIGLRGALLLPWALLIGTIFLAPALNPLRAVRVEMPSNNASSGPD